MIITKNLKTSQFENRTKIFWVIPNLTNIGSITRTLNDYPNHFEHHSSTQPT